MDRNKNGLNSYTGQNLKIFKSHPNDRYSLPSNHIIHLTQDSLNDIWISTRQGMVRYDETHGNFIPFNHDIIYSSLCIMEEYFSEVRIEYTNMITKNALLKQYASPPKVLRTVTLPNIGYKEL